MGTLRLSPGLLHLYSAYSLYCVAKSKCILSSRTRIRSTTPISSTPRPLHLKADIWPPAPSRKLMYKKKRASTLTLVLFPPLLCSDFQVADGEKQRGRICGQLCWIKYSSNLSFLTTGTMLLCLKTQVL